MSTATLTRSTPTAQTTGELESNDAPTAAKQLSIDGDDVTGPPSPISTRSIRLTVLAVFYLAALVVFRDVLMAIPSILRGEATLTGDELVPFFNPNSQLFSQAAGQFNELTNGYEFRVRYAFLTTWLRYYKVLPFAILIVIPGIFYAAYLSTARFIDRVFTSLSSSSIYLATFFPIAFAYMIVLYAKVTHFYTLMLGLAMVTISILNTLLALLFVERGWRRRIVFASVLVLFNPAVHYLVLYTLFFGLTITTLILGDVARSYRKARAHKLKLVRRVHVPHPSRPGETVTKRDWLGFAKRFLDSVTWRCIGAGIIVFVVTLLPYALFVKFVALRGVPNLSETVPGDFYFISDASVSWLHLISWDLAGITDKLMYGDYLSKVPRWRNVIYTLLLVVPIVVRPIKRSLFRTRPQRQLLAVIYVVVGFAFWATIGYGQPTWFPSFHRAIAQMSLAANERDGSVAGLIVQVNSTIVQVLRFPHRFQLLLFVLGPLIMSLTLAWGIDRLSAWLTATPFTGLRRSRTIGRRPKRRPPGRTDQVIIQLVATAWIGSVFFVPFLSNPNYRHVYGSGDFGTFLAPYPLGDLQDLRDTLRSLPEGKTVMLPPTETSKRVLDANGIDHKMIDKFYIYYLDQPSYYYGLTGDTENKFEFFLMLRGMYYGQDWWVNVARDIDVRYIVADRTMHGNGGVGTEYLPGLEEMIEPAIQYQSDKFKLRYENKSFALYELIDPPNAQRTPLLIDAGWQSYLDAVFSRLNLSRCYDLEYLPYFDPAKVADKNALLLTSDRHASAIDLYLLQHPELIGKPDQRIFAFNPNIVASSYYLSPMFRSFLFFSNTKWNRTRMLTPGVYGTLRGSFVGVPRATQLAINVHAPTDGRYRVLLRGAVTANEVDVTNAAAEYSESFDLRPSEGHTVIYDVESIYSDERIEVDTSSISATDLEQRIGHDLVPVNRDFEYLDLGIVDAKAGIQQFSITKHDNNPILIEGLMLIPEADYQSIGVPRNFMVIPDVTLLNKTCRQQMPVRTNDDSYVDPAENSEHADLSEQELADLAAGSVGELNPPDPASLDAAKTSVIQAAWLIAAGFGLIQWRMRQRDDDDDDDDDDDGDDDDGDDDDGDGDGDEPAVREAGGGSENERGDRSKGTGRPVKSDGAAATSDTKTSSSQRHAKRPTSSASAPAAIKERTQPDKTNRARSGAALGRDSNADPTNDKVAVPSAADRGILTVGSNRLGWLRPDAASPDDVADATVAWMSTPRARSERRTSVPRRANHSQQTRSTPRGAPIDSPNGQSGPALTQLIIPDELTYLSVPVPVTASSLSQPETTP